MPCEPPAWARRGSSPRSGWTPANAMTTTSTSAPKRSDERSFRRWRPDPNFELIDADHRSWEPDYRYPIALGWLAQQLT